ncbi:MAG: hypothetical protein LBQ75_02520 [Zoogloeaceae bacterium]|jgi:hypothetical protein|nr:hypothetical protein [Zoogloeaceae bacterium]
MNNSVKRFPWEIKLTPEEEQEVLAKALKHKPKLTVFRWIARVMSAAFFVWFILGYFSVYFVVPFSWNSVFKLSGTCMFPHYLCYMVSRYDQRVEGFERLDNNNEIVIFNRRILKESLSLFLLHGAIAFIAL